MDLVAATFGLLSTRHSYVLDLTKFIKHHPGTARKIINERREAIDISLNFLDHFGHTVRAFREACKQYEAGQVPVILTFSETGKEHEVVIIGKVED